MSKWFVKIFVIVLIWNCLPINVGLGQTRNDLVRALERFDRQFEVVQKLVRSFENQRAIQLVNEARALRNQAVADFENKNFVAAGAKIKMAFLKLEQAVRITLEGPLRRLRSRLEELMRRADNVVLGSKHKEAERILREAKLNRDAAERALAAKEINVAVEHYRVAITLTRRSIDLVRRDVGSVRDRMIEERKRFEVLRQRALDVVEKSADPRVKHIFDQADKLALSAEEAFKNHKFELAKRFLNQSILLLLRVMDMAGGESPSAVNQTRVALFRLKDLIEDSRKIVFNSQRPRAKLLFERAKRFEREAELAAGEGRGYEALWKIELAETMIRRAMRIVEGRDEPRFTSKIAQEIENTKDDIAAIRKKVSVDSPKDAQVLINMSQFAIQRAERASSAGFQRLALEAVLASQRFLTKAERILTTQATSSISKEKIGVRLNQLNEAIEESEKRVAESELDWPRRLLDGAKDIRKMAVESFQKGNYRAADEGIQVAFELIRKSLKNVSER
jgi:HEPN domain-containing protein